MSWQAEVEQTVVGLEYTLVETERLSNGLLRVFIEHPNGTPAITVDDCEKVTRQLQFVLEVAGIEYQRLEVSSPGLDHPLKTEDDYARFMGELVEVAFKRAIDLVSANGKSYQQRKFVGRIESAEEGVDGWVLIVEPDAQQDNKSKTRKKSDEEVHMALGFTLNEVREARLVPIVDFKGRQKDDAAGSGDN